MTYPKDTPLPVRAKVTNRTNGEPITTGVNAYYHVGTTRVAVTGDPAEHVSGGTWVYVPTEAEVDVDEFAIEFYHSDAVANGPQVTVYTTGDILVLPGGSEPVTITVESGGVPIQHATVVLRSGGSIIDLQTTNADGVAELTADPGTYDLRVARTGYASHQESLEVPAGAVSKVELTAVTLSPSTEPDSVTVCWTVRSYTTRQAVGEGEATVYFRLLARAGSGNAWQRQWQTETTNSTGTVSFANVPKGSQVEAKLGKGGVIQYMEVPYSAVTPFHGPDLWGVKED